MRDMKTTIVLLLMSIMTACGSQVAEFADHSAADADVGSDSTIAADAIADAGSDALADTGPDAVADAGTDTTADTGPDAVADAGTDTTADTGPDAVADAGTDAVTDTGPDVIVTKGPEPVQLGTAGNFAILAKAAISSVPASSITGDIGLSPAAVTLVTGFSLIADLTNIFSTSTQVVGKVYAANHTVPTPVILTLAVANMEAAYTDAASRPTPDFLELGTGNIGGKTLVPGLYKWTSSITIAADVVLSGGAQDVWIFQTTGNVIQSAAVKVKLSGGALAKNVFWQVAGNATLGTGAHFEGILLCKTDVTLQTGATMNGRLLAQTAVVLQMATVTQPAQ